VCSLKIQLVLTVRSCAEMNGVPEELVSRAEELILVSMKGEDLVKACCQMPRDEATELEEAVSRIEPSLK
jgi:DNA mismatch repair protein MSH5